MTSARANMFAGMWSKATGAMKKEEKVEKTATNASSAWGAETAEDAKKNEEKMKKYLKIRVTEERRHHMTTFLLYIFLKPFLSAFRLSDRISPSLRAFAKRS